MEDRQSRNHVEARRRQIEIVADSDDVRVSDPRLAIDRLIGFGVTPRDYVPVGDEIEALGGLPDEAGRVA